MEKTVKEIFDKAFTLFDSYITMNQEFMRRFSDLKDFGLNYVKLVSSHASSGRQAALRDQLDNLMNCLPPNGFDQLKLKKELSKNKSVVSTTIKLAYPKSVRHFKCKVCHKNFTKEAAFWRHKNLHKYQMFACSKCSKRFSKQTHLISHTKSHLKTEPAEEIITNSIVEDEHVIKKLDCNLCGRQFNFSSHLKKHLQDHEADTMFPCYFCSQQFTNRPNLSNHIKSHVQPNGSYKCISCNHSFELFKDLKNHAKLLHDYQEKFICKKCNKSFHTLKHFRLHQKIHL